MPSNEESIEERTRRIVGELDALVGELVSAGTERVAAVEEEAEARVGRYHDASEELDAARREIARHEKDREQLPSLAFKANMDEDFVREDELREKYRAIRPALESLRERAGELEAELRGLVGPNPTPRGDLDAQLTAYEAVRDTYGEVATPLIEIKHQVVPLLRDAVDAFAAGQEGWGQTLMGLRSERDGDPGVRARSLQKRGIRVESAVSTPKV